MTLAKTDAGLRMLRERQSGLSPRQRAALILLDGQRTLEDVLAATSGGVTREDIQRLVELGLVAEQGPESQPFADSVPAERDRYLQAYRVAAELVAQLGPRWSSLHLAVEAAGSLDELQALAPRMEAALGPVQYGKLAPLLTTR
ncbi:MAG TPA: hypothetical protein VGD76_16165 [Ramlibacter sp.]